MLSSTQAQSYKIVDYSVETEPKFPEIQTAQGVHHSSPEISDSSDQEKEADKGRPVKQIRSESEESRDVLSVSSE